MENYSLNFETVNKKGEKETVTKIFSRADRAELTEWISKIHSRGMVLVFSPLPYGRDMERSSFCEWRHDDVVSTGRTIRFRGITYPLFIRKCEAQTSSDALISKERAREIIEQTWKERPAAAALLRSIGIE